MPGIGRLFSWRGSNVCSRLVGGDGGVHAVFVGWAALEDSFAHCQPIISERADVVLLLARECLSDPDIRSKLKARVHHFEDNNAAWMLDQLGVRHAYSLCRLP